MQARFLLLLSPAIVLIGNLSFPSYSAAGEKQKLAVTQLTAKSGISQDQLDVLGDMVATELRNLGKYEVVTKEDIESMLGLEKTKEFLGCDSTSCMAEIGGALGVDLIVSGNVAKFGQVFAVNLKLINIKRATVINSVFRKVNGEQALLDDLGGAVKDLMSTASGRDGTGVARPGETSATPTQVAGPAPGFGPGKGVSKEASEEKEEEEREEGIPFRWLGPLQMDFVPNTMGAMSPVPETRIGAVLDYRYFLVEGFLPDPESDFASDLEVSVTIFMIHAGLAITDWLEAGLELEALRSENRFVLDADIDDTSDDFGFTKMYGKATLVDTGSMALAAGLGMTLPTATDDRWKDNMLFVLEPGLHFAFRYPEYLGFHSSLFFPLLLFFPDKRDDYQEYFTALRLGTSIMPIRYVGGVLEMEIDLRLNPEGDQETFNRLVFSAGLRSRPVDFLYIDLAAFGPVAGQVTDDVTSSYGIRFNISYTPDFFY